MQLSSEVIKNVVTYISKDIEPHIKNPDIKKFMSGHDMTVYMTTFRWHEEQSPDGKNILKNLLEIKEPVIGHLMLIYGKLFNRLISMRCAIYANDGDAMKQCMVDYKQVKRIVKTNRPEFDIFSLYEAEMIKFARMHFSGKPADSYSYNYFNHGRRGNIS